MSIKIDRINNNFVEAISKILHDDMKDKTAKDITITDVKITNDLSIAKVYFTSMNTDIDKVLLSLNRANGFIRSRLCEMVKIRKMPELIFVYDESIEYANKIEGIIERINRSE